MSDSALATKKPALPPGAVATGEGAPVPKRRSNWRKTLFRLHGWVGLNTGLLLFVICFSGSVATLSNEIDWLLDARHRVEAREAPYDWAAMHRAVGQAFPDGQNLGVYAPGSGYAPPGGQAAAVSYVALPNGQTRKVYLNPYTGAVQGHTSFFNAQRFFRSFHRRFFDGTRGIVLVTLMALPLLVAALTGFFFYKGWLRQLITLRRDKGQRLLWSDLHKGAGIWGLLFTLLIALTGLFYLVELGFQAADDYETLLPEPLPQVDASTLPDLGPQPTLLPANQYVEAARQALPGLDVLTVRMPQALDQAVYVDGQAGNPLTRDRANRVHLHPFTGDVLGVQKSTDLGPVAFITDAADPLHFGYFGGLWTKVLWCILGLLLSFSILSGTYLWVVRSATGRRARSRWLRGAVVSAALTLAYFGLVLFAVLQGVQGYTPPRAPDTEVTRLEAGPYRVTVTCQSPCRPAEGATLTARFQGAGMPNLRRAALRGPGTASVPMNGPARAPKAEVTATPGQMLTLQLVPRDGEPYETRFALPPLQKEAPTTTRPRWPDTAPGVWWVVAGFALLTCGVILGWLAALARVLGRAQATA